MESIDLSDGAAVFGGVRDGSPQQIDLAADPGSEKWVVIIGQSLQRIGSPLRGVGAIIVEGETSLPRPAATVWRVGTDLVVTNAHVAEEVCIRNQSAPPGDATFGYRLRPNGNTLVDFALERGAAAAKVWTVAELVYLAGPDDVDAAVFRLAPRPDHGALPAALAVGTNKDSVQQKVDVFAAGHPVMTRERRRGGRECSATSAAQALGQARSCGSGDRRIRP